MNFQLSAQIMTKRGYNFYTVNTTKEAKLRKQEGRIALYDLLWSYLVELIGF